MPRVRAYYNEIDPFAAIWLRVLITFGLIAEGDVDTRSIEDVTASDIAGYTQCHFFAGIGGWSYALRLSGWPDSRPVWTLSCPCQPFSAAGKGGGFADERHLWPAGHWLIAQRRPVTIFGEQVASKDGLAWLDTVQADMERTSYSVGAVDICAAGIGAPHIRQRLYWRADSCGVSHAVPSRCGARRSSQTGNGGRQTREQLTGLCKARDLSDSPSGLASNGNLQCSGEHGLLASNLCISDRGNATVGGLSVLGSPSGSSGYSAFPSQLISRDDGVVTGLEGLGGDERNWRGPGWLKPAEVGSITASGATRGFWSGCDWWHGRDEKYRPIEPGLFPLAHGVPGRVGKLRGYGNAIVPELAAEFIQASEEIE